MKDKIKKLLLKESYKHSRRMFEAEISDEIDKNLNLDFSSFKMRDDFNPKIWVDGYIRPNIKTNLIKIAHDFFDSLDLTVEVKDIVVTGSIANYNWSKYSDVDLHILIETSELEGDPVMIEDFLRTKSRAWNDEHDIKMRGFDVEIYVQDVNEEHTSTGVYSLMDDNWILKPDKDKIELDKPTITKKYKAISDELSEIEEMTDEKKANEKLEKLKQKIRTMRKSGLSSEGEFSSENIVFKLLRRRGDLEKLYNLATKTYDDTLTIESNRLMEGYNYNKIPKWFKK